ncbi:Hypothetical protein NTJ_06429 [Nesidiocoris tenuis]|uniref:Uncharacterized protein n=1 Tax=Nesidiocoris tenuis TaxID=355587 RepID=A0ABN7AN21_9HEMI|nr:Hypothetical protein NTJ_06429 [Nesidiocoris tenuis]
MEKVENKKERRRRNRRCAASEDSLPLFLIKQRGSRELKALALPKELRGQQRTILLLFQSLSPSILSNSNKGHHDADRLQVANPGSCDQGYLVGRFEG